MEGGMRKVQFYLEGKHYVGEFPVSYEIKDLEDWMKNKPDFIHQLQENGKNRIPNNSKLEFRYNSMESNPTQKNLKLSEFHPKKRLIFYVQEISTNSVPPRPSESLYPPLSSGNLHIPSTGRIDHPGNLGNQVGTGFQSPLQSSIDDKINVIVTDAENNQSYNVLASKTNTTIREIIQKAVMTMKGNQKIKYTTSYGATAKPYSTIKDLTLEGLFRIPPVPQGVSDQVPNSLKLQVHLVYVAGRA